MKQLAILILTLGSINISDAQGIRGNITFRGRGIVSTTGHIVTLTWTSSQNASSYNIYRGTTHGGSYAKVGSAVSCTTYSDVQVTHSQTFYYVTTSVDNGKNESGYSNEAVAVIP